jgi:rubrerythrin
MDSCVFNEVIVFATRKEAESANLYRVYADLAETSNVKNMFKKMRREELKHQKLLESIKLKDVSAYKLKDIPDLKIGDYSTEGEFSPDMKYADALMLAIKKEEVSYKLYQDLASGPGDEDLKKLFLVLASEEAKHKLKLEEEYDKTVMSEN